MASNETKLKNKLTNRKGKLTQKLNTIRKMIATRSGMKDDWRALMLLAEVFDLLDEVYEAVPTDDVSVLAKAATVRKKAADKQAEDMESVQLAIANCTTIGFGANATPLSSGPVTPKVTFKPVLDLKPTTLTAKFTTPEMRHWVRKFKLYFKSLHGEMLPISGQKGILGNLLSSALETALTYLLEHLDKDLQDCMVALELHFLTLKPILGRRWDMLQLKKTFCPMKDFMTEVRAFTAEAELTKLTPEKIQVLVVLRGCRKEAALYRELRKIEEPTMDKLLAAGLLEEKLAREVATSHVITAVGASPAVETAKEIMGNCRCIPGCGRGHTHC